MKRLCWMILIVFSLLCSCGKEAGQFTGDGSAITSLDDHIDAPVVSCEQAFSLFRYSSIATDSPDRKILELTFNKKGVGLAIIRKQQMWRITEDEATWEKLDLPSTGIYPSRPVFADDNTVYAVHRSRSDGMMSLLRSNNQGLTFQPAGPGLWRSIVDMKFTAANEGQMLVRGRDAARGFALGLLTTTNGGASWTTLRLPSRIGPRPRLLSLSHQLAIQTRENLLVSIGNGDWEVRPYPVPALTVIFNGERGILVSKDGVRSKKNLFYTSDGGRNWKTDNVLYSSPRNLELFEDGSALMTIRRYQIMLGDALVSNGLLVYQSNNGGATWNVTKTESDCGITPFQLAATANKRVSVRKDNMAILER